jgi:uncharacterized protein DUF2795
VLFGRERLAELHGCDSPETGYERGVHAEVVMLQTLLEGVPLPADKRDLIAYAREQDDHVPAGLLERLPDREYRSLDEVGEALAPVQPSAARDETPLPLAESRQNAQTERQEQQLGR